jgi:hypothetical protein
MPLRRLLTGHGAPVTDHRQLIRDRLREHDQRGERILAILGDGPRSAYEIARRLWRPRTVVQQPLLVVWEVIGNLELLLADGDVVERLGDTGSVFERALPRRTAAARWPRRPKCGSRG